VTSVELNFIFNNVQEEYGLVKDPLFILKVIAKCTVTVYPNSLSYACGRWVSDDRFVLSGAKLNLSS